jgi:hypothetical protein
MKTVHRALITCAALLCLLALSAAKEAKACPENRGCFEGCECSPVNGVSARCWYDEAANQCKCDTVATNKCVWHAEELD